MYRIVYTKQSIKDLENLKRAGLASRAQNLVHIMRENPYQNPPGYEKLVGNLTGAYSRRIIIQHRIVYQVIEEPDTVNGVYYDGTVKMLRMWTHYENL